MDMQSPAQPSTEPAALRRLVDQVLAGEDVILFTGRGNGQVSLDAMAGILSTLRTRILRATDALPDGLGLPMLMAQAIGQSRTAVQDDEFLGRVFQALTVLDATCDRIVLLINGAHALQRPALRYLQYACRKGPHLQLVLAGRRGCLDLLAADEFAQLRGRLAAAPVLAPLPAAWEPALAARAARPAPAARPASVARPAPVADAPRAPRWTETALPAAVSVPNRSSPLFGALAGIGLGLAATVSVAVWTGWIGGPAASGRPAVAVTQPPPAAGASPPAAAGARSTAAGARETPGAAALDAPRLPQAAATDEASGPAPASRSVVTVVGQGRGDAPGSKQDEPQKATPPGPAQSPGRQGAPIRSRAAARRALTLPARAPTEFAEPYSPPPEDWQQPQPAFDPWVPGPGRPQPYVGTYTTDANGIRIFRYGP